MKVAPDIDFAALFARVNENRNRLDGCKRHLFAGDLPGIAGGVGAMIGQKVECIRCKGKIGLIELSFYIRGYEAAGKSGNDILPGWREPADDTPRRRYFGQGEGT